MLPPRRALVLAAALLMLAPSARAVSITFQLDPEWSVAIHSTAEDSTVEFLSGSFTVELGALPLGGAPTSFDVIELAIEASGGTTIGLDPAIPNPGLGVLDPDGSFLIPTLFVRVDHGSVFDIALPNLSGGVFFGPGGASLAGLFISDFSIPTSDPPGVIHVQIEANPVPGPGAAALLALGFAALGARRARTEGSR